MFKASRNRNLRLEYLEKKNLLAGDVMANLVGGDLYITGDLDDNSIQIVRDVSLTSPGVGDVVVQGLFSNPTTVNGMASESFTVTGDVYIDFSAGGENAAIFGDNPGFQPDPVQLPGDVSLLGGDGTDSLSFTNAEIDANVSFDDAAGGEFSFLGTSSGTVIGGNFTMDSAAEGAEIGVDGSTVAGDVVMLGNSASDESFLGIYDSTVGDDVLHISVAGTATTEIEETSIGDDLQIKTGDGDDSASLAGITVGDDLVFNGGSGDDVLEIGGGAANSSVGDDLIVSGKAGNDEIVIEDTDIGDKLRISGNGGDDFVGASGLTVGRSVLISLGDGVNEADITDVSGARSLTVLGMGENVITLNEISTSHFVTVLTANGNDLVSMFEVDTHSAMIATRSGADEVEIVDSAFEYLFVQMGSGDDTLTLEGVTVDRFAVLSGGSGCGDELIDNGDNDINFAIDFAFESGTI